MEEVNRNRKGILTAIGLAIIFVVLAIRFFPGQTICTRNIEFIDDDVVCRDKPTIKKVGYATTQDKLERYIASEKEKGNVEKVSLYFRDLKSGPIFGINEFADFAPASLLKLPLALTYFLTAEKTPEILDQELSFTVRSSFEKALDSSGSIHPGVNYPAEELIKRMLVNSDNNAYELLFRNYAKNYGSDMIGQIFLELGILSPNDAFDRVITVRRYASLLRGLYKASLVSPENSEKILSWLAESSYDNGLAAGIGKDIKIANKYGERLSGTGEKQLHDCGIIYYPGNPYLLCVMTLGDSYEELEKIIADVSRTVYIEIDSRKL